MEALAIIGLILGTLNMVTIWGLFVVYKLSKIYKEN